TKVRIADLGMTAFPAPTADLSKYVADETEKGAKVIRAANSRPEWVRRSITPIIGIRPHGLGRGCVACLTYRSGSSGHRTSSLRERQAEAPEELGEDHAGALQDAQDQSGLHHVGCRSRPAGRARHWLGRGAAFPGRYHQG